ncbi:uncharacterized protein EI90DRAFT_3073803 [Cantharellus anzutake]|uniref:uncharacterized protein n=1 Tax=Cantharellus anzutake TaxID=1750568 RepID=UPI00190318E6|nr:uncharacterized protein EI90DRAFT_3073803 [Cantharellus anzutake]KAF8325071.1 hypothetical protein EI90DRAFT_3073803 [Cantharellus anzutake]
MAGPLCHHCCGCPVEPTPCNDPKGVCFRGASRGSHRGKQASWNGSGATQVPSIQSWAPVDMSRFQGTQPGHGHPRLSQRAGQTSANGYCGPASSEIKDSLDEGGGSGDWLFDTSKIPDHPRFYFSPKQERIPRDIQGITRAKTQEEKAGSWQEVE